MRIGEKIDVEGIACVFLRYPYYKDVHPDEDNAHAQEKCQFCAWVYIPTKNSNIEFLVWKTGQNWVLHRGNKNYDDLKKIWERE